MGEWSVRGKGGGGEGEGRGGGRGGRGWIGDGFGFGVEVGVGGILWWLVVVEGVVVKHIDHGCTMHLKRVGIVQRAKKQQQTTKTT